MNLNVTNIQIDGENVNEVLWVKSGETSIHTGMIISTPLKFNVDEYTLENPGETAIITVKTDNNIYKDIELNRCVPKCDCDIFNVVCESRKFVHQTGGTVDFSYTFDEEAVGKCSEGKIDCTTKADFVTITHNRETRVVSANFTENHDVRRNAKIVFSYGDENCDVFTITQGSLVDNCNKKLTIYKEPSTLTCQGGQVQFSVATTPIDECDGTIKIKAKNNETTVSNCGGEVQYELVYVPPVKCNNKILITTETAVIKSDGETVYFNVTAPGVEDFDANNLTWDINHEVVSIEVKDINTVAITFPENENYTNITYTIRCDDANKNCGTIEMPQQKRPRSLCNLTKVYEYNISANGGNNLHLFTYSADICSKDNFSINYDLDGISYDLTYSGRMYFNIPANPNTDGRDIVITITQSNGGVSSTESYTFHQLGKSDISSIKFILRNGTQKIAYISGKMEIYTNRSAGKSVNARSIAIPANFSNSDENTTHNKIILNPGDTVETTVSWENIKSLNGHYFAASDTSTLNAVRLYHVGKRPQNIETGVEEDWQHIMKVAPITDKIIEGGVYNLEITGINDTHKYWNPGTDSGYPIKESISETKVKFRYQDGKCATAQLKDLTDGGKQWQDVAFGECNKI